MKLARVLALLVAAFCSAGAVHAQLEMVTNAVPQSVFFGDARPISATFHNPGAQEFRQAVRVEISQTTSAMVVPLGARSWKELRVLPGQTVLESAPLDFPPVKTETKFLVEWVYGTGNIIGKTEVLVYPTNLLDQLKLLVDDSEDNLGLLDPDNQLKPALREAALKFVDLGETELGDFSGKLAIVGPFRSKTQMREGLTNDLKSLARKGPAIVWLKPPRGREEKLPPSFYSVRKTTNAMVVVQPDLLADFSENPQSQLNLIYFCELALQPESPIAQP